MIQLFILFYFIFFLLALPHWGATPWEAVHVVVPWVVAWIGHAKRATRFCRTDKLVARERKANVNNLACLYLHSAWQLAQLHICWTMRAAYDILSYLLLCCIARVLLGDQ
ncbi:hypothetical protein BX600DRAFT_312817 [Xylariales sp. PMI_506]|nr:hypothetical protein BX600DRAFT_312817 [Xylariales sp. PMI_506]